MTPALTPVPLAQEHLAPLGAFFASLDAGDLTFIKEDVRDPATLARWLADERSWRQVVLAEDGSVAAYVALLPMTGWSAHVAELRLVVAPDRRHSGLGRALVQAALVGAARLDLRKLVVEVVAAQEATAEMFRRLGWHGEALLEDHIRDRDGELRDLLVLAYTVEDRLTSMETAGVADSLSAG